MDKTEKIKRRLHSAFKLSGFVIRKEFVGKIVQTFIAEDKDLGDIDVFDNCVKNISASLERQCLNGRSIELENVTRAIEICLHAGHEKNEIVFNIINAFDIPKLKYDPDRKLYLLVKKKPTLLSGPESKAELFLDRYTTILHRTQRNFKHKLSDNEADILKLQTVDYLLTVCYKTLDKTLILGSLLQVYEGKYYLEDPTGIVELDLSHAKYHGGFFVENCFVLVNGCYEDKVLQVSTLILPPGEEYTDSRLSFGNINYFGGDSSLPLRDSTSLKEYMNSHPHKTILFFSDLWLDHPLVFEKLETLFHGMQVNPPIAFIFMGNFMSESHGSGYLDILRKLFKQLGDILIKYDALVHNSEFVFIPGMTDPCTPHLVPRLSLPKYVTEGILKIIPKAIFATNPCRLQYCNKEIVLFRADVLAKMMQGTMYKPQKDEIGDCATRTLISQGHLSPLSLNALTVHWDFDYTLRLYPLPNLVVIGDKSECYQGKYKGCQVVNPGSFCDSGFQFKCYNPYNDELDDCML